MSLCSRVQRGRETSLPQRARPLRRSSQVRKLLRERVKVFVIE